MSEPAAAPRRVEADPWIGSRRIEAWAGESRLNMVRGAALVLFYLNHLVHLYYYQDRAAGGRYHELITAMVLCGVGVCLLVTRLLQHGFYPGWFPYVTAGWDVLLVTTAASLRDGPRSALVQMYFMVIAGSALRLCRSVVIATLAMVAVGYFFLLSYAKLLRPDLAVPHPAIYITYLCFLFAAVLAGQSVRQARRLVSGHPVPVVEG